MIFFLMIRPPPKSSLFPHTALFRSFDPKLQTEFVSTGIFNLMVPLRNRAALGKIAMNMIELRKLQGKNATMAYCFAPNGNGKVCSRGMLPWELYEIGRAHV